jgi:apolipoprotein N-acyltransferase
VNAAEEAALRVEHDELAGRVATRHSIDDVRRGAYASFALIMTAGLSVKFAWDRWGWGLRSTKPMGRYPLLFLGALGLSLLLAFLAVAAFRRARRAMKDEDRDFGRLREVRQRLGMDT